MMKKHWPREILISAMALGNLNLMPACAQPGLSPYYKAPNTYAGRTFVIPAGTTFEGRIETTIGSTVSKQGSPFTITIASPVLANGSDVLIPAGAIVLGEVVSAVPAKDVPHAKKEKPVGKLRVQINALKMPSGTTYPMVASLVGEEAVGDGGMNLFASRLGGYGGGSQARGSGVAYVGTPTGFQTVAPGTAHFNARTGVSQVVTKNEMLNDPIMGRNNMGGKTAMRSLVKKNRNLFIYSGSPLTIRLEAPFKLSLDSSAAEESALRSHSTEMQRAKDTPSANQPALAQPGGGENKQSGLTPQKQSPQSNSQDSNF